MMQSVNNTGILQEKKWSLLGVKPPTPKISLVILLTVYYIIPMILVQRI